MTDDWRALTWPRARLAEALSELADAVGLARPTSGLSEVSPSPGLDDEQLEAWLTLAASQAGLRLQHTDSSYADLQQTLERLGPALLALGDGAERRHLVILASDRRSSLALGPDRRRVRVPHRELARRLTASLEREAAVPVAHWLSALPVAARRQRRAERCLRELLLGERRVGGFALVRPDPGAGFAAELRRRGFRGRAALVLGLCLAQVALSLGGWLVLGRGALDGHIDAGWLWAWCLLHVTALALQLAVTWSGGVLVRDASALLKQRLLCGASRIDVDRIRTRGSGRLLAMVFESEALETAGLGGAFGLMLSLVQLLGAALTLALGTSAASQLLLLSLWCACVALLLVRYLRQRGVWTRGRFALARAFVENVVGNRTRVVQQPRRRWHTREDEQLEQHHAAGAAMDATQTRLLVLPGRGFLLLGCLGLVPALLGTGVRPAELALGLLGLVQGAAALGAFCAGAVTFGGASSAWRELGELFHAASSRGGSGDPRVALGTAPRPSAGAVQPESDPGRCSRVLDIRGLSFRYPQDHVPVLRGCELALEQGERALVQGASGAGKSTLAALLTGMRQPDAGHVLLSGLDRRTLGDEAWRRRVASAPQFHENHILSGSLAFNLLLGRRWPATAGDLREAEELCDALGLGALLARMPSGLNQVIGETGWQLSHGERSRIFLARALLQDADLIVLDESFGALDSRSLTRCMQAVLARARTLIVIAHP